MRKGVSMALRADSNGIDASLYRRNGSWSTALVDASLGTTGAQEAADRLPDEVAKLLKSQQAQPQDVQALIGVLEPASGLRAPVARFVAVHDGEVVLNEIIPGLKVSSPSVDVGPFPNFTAIARARGGLSLTSSLRSEKMAARFICITLPLRSALLAKVSSDCLKKSITPEKCPANMTNPRRSPRSTKWFAAMLTKSLS